MSISKLRKRLQKNRPIFYGDKKVKVIKIYEKFMLVDISYYCGSQIFTVDILILNDQPINEIKLHNSKISNIKNKNQIAMKLN